jgi:hypothetical protein
MAIPHLYVSPSGTSVPECKLEDLDLSILPQTRQLQVNASQPHIVVMIELQAGHFHDTALQNDQPARFCVLCGQAVYAVDGECPTVSSTFAEDCNDPCKCGLCGQGYERQGWH